MKPCIWLGLLLPLSFYHYFRKNLLHQSDVEPSILVSPICLLVNSNLHFFQPLPPFFLLFPILLTCSLFHTLAQVLKWNPPCLISPSSYKSGPHINIDFLYSGSRSKNICVLYVLWCGIDWYLLCCLDSSKMLTVACRILRRT